MNNTELVADFFYMRGETKKYTRLRSDIVTLTTEILS